MTNEILKLISQVKDISNKLLDNIESGSITIESLKGNLLVYTHTIDFLQQLAPKTLYLCYEEFFSSFYEFCLLCENDKFLEENIDTLFSTIALFAECMEEMQNEWEKNAKKCACCGEQVWYNPISDYYGEMKGKYTSEHIVISETLNRKEYMCPSCHCSDRDRMIVSFMKKQGLQDAVDGIRILQFAPAEPITNWITQNIKQAYYDTTDLFMNNVSFKSDIQNMNMVDDETYDVLICSHVLEHVKDDRKAMAEMKRIMKPDGKLIFLVPTDLNSEQIDEEWGLSEEENWRRFGQGDHCRSYGKKAMVERLEEFYYVHQLTKEYFGEEIFKECGLIDTSTLYVCTKNKEVELKF